MIKLLRLAVIVIVISLTGALIHVKYNPPLDAYGIGSSSDKRVLLVGVGNKSRFAEIRIEDVLVNDNTRPSNVNIQVSDPSKGFIVSDDPEAEEAQNYHFEDLNAIRLQTDTDRQEQASGKASGKDTVYAVTIGHDESIHQVSIAYRYLGLPYREVIQTKW
ncbi:hypothetical protein [Paenibacillus arenilitoris]|uniref:Uncharacterized protein n=1 Tax=Paenibacillus arenilitoris TaxID=2772299 RepID=A0A927H7H6_9BACL|nr:hypothetical protein [Paenibacillus arenilitoris]MBD2871621.1 hypothetical protein [Paenibacillus arenilitoris]